MCARCGGGARNDCRTAERKEGATNGSPDEKNDRLVEYDSFLASRVMAAEGGNMDDLDQLMAMAAHEYCLYRRSYIVAACREWLLRIWPRLSGNTRSIILRNTAEALADCRAPLIDDWIEAGRWMAQNMNDEQIAEVNRMLAWKGIDDVRDFFVKGYRQHVKS